MVYGGLFKEFILLEGLCKSDLLNFIFLHISKFIIKALASKARGRA